MNDYNKRHDDIFTAKVLKLLPLIIALVSVIAVATTLKNKVDAIEIRSIANESRGTATDLRVASLDTEVSMIKANTDRLVNELLDKK